MATVNSRHGPKQRRDMTVTSGQPLSDTLSAHMYIPVSCGLSYYSCAVHSGSRRSRQGQFLRRVRPVHPASKCLLLPHVAGAAWVAVQSEPGTNGYALDVAICQASRSPSPPARTDCTSLSGPTSPLPIRVDYSVNRVFPFADAGRGRLDSKARNRSHSLGFPPASV